MKIYDKNPNFFFVGVIFPLPNSIDIKVFIYLAPLNLKNDIEIGKRVEVPFRNKIKLGIVYELENFDLENLEIIFKEIIKVIDDENFFTKEMLEVSKKISEYYLCSLGEAINLFLPKTKNFKKNIEIKKFFDNENLENFYSKNFLTPNIYQENAIKTISKSIKNNSYNEFLLFGCPGSGKTEVYLHLILRTLNLNKNIIYLVPEISLIPQTFLRLEIRFKGLVNALHSQMTASQKSQIYKNILQNKTKILIATRSGIFAPFKNLGLIIIDEEHDPSFKNAEKPFYDARNVASFRAKILNSTIVLGSATPSIDTYYRIKKENILEMPYKAKSLKNLNNFTLLNSNKKNKNIELNPKKSEISKHFNPKDYNSGKLNIKNFEKFENEFGNKFEHKSKIEIEKINDLKNQNIIENIEEYQNSKIFKEEKNDIVIINMKLEILKKNYSMISEYLRKKIIETLDKKKQVLLFLNRRGDSTFVFCRKCGFVYKCKNCDIPLVYHSDNENLICHYCGYSIKNSNICPSCKSKYIKHFGFAIQKIEREIKNFFPNAKIARLDSDLMRKNKNYNEKIFKDFKNQNIDILLGTQIISKGLDFENIDLVGIISADTMLNLSDFRAGEKTFSLLVQTIGRAGRREKGLGIIQTYYPDNYAIKSAKNLDYKKFFLDEIKWRKELFYPPFSRIILLTLRSKNENLAKNEITLIYQKIKNFNDKKSLNFIILGPYKSSIYKKYNNFYYQILIKTNLFSKISLEFLNILENYKNSNAKLSIEVDPL